MIADSRSGSPARIIQGTSMPVSTRLRAGKGKSVNCGPIKNDSKVIDGYITSHILNIAITFAFVFIVCILMFQYDTKLRVKRRWQ